MFFRFSLVKLDGFLMIGGFQPLWLFEFPRRAKGWVFTGGEITHSRLHGWLMESFCKDFLKFSRVF